MESIVEPLYRKVRQDIVECELTPGRAFSEAELGRLYNASRTPVREACRRLEHEGLIRIIPFRGYMIAPLSVAEFHDLEEMQLIFEPEAAALAAERANAEELEEMTALASYEYRVGDRTSYREFIQKNYQLHTLIAQSTRNKRLFDVVSNIHIRLMRFFYLGLPFDSYGPALVNEHIQLIDAICERKSEEARSRATEHIRMAMDRSASLLMSAIRFGEAVFDASSTLDGTIPNTRSRARRS
ncbi:MAG: GntR family transcriptional regulator [Edaphobacter sp.]|uniref:GntR family transcriptional regulator n=1 Tax=Edaphobacter sp. TaxID=1934404 RepID=UPI002399E7DF|nr:GntR family transcriptional regulator [Edaphobacter sp.]MDE1177973.1 GntR family transcriptional regulator [Edaphobacter sp.]